ncbi:MAG: insulinase family protein, partial [Ferruginibacter sp.]
MLNRKTAPSIIDAVNFKLHLKPYHHFTLDNGVPVYTINAGAQEVIQIELVLYAGNWYEKNKGVASATNFMLKNGTTTRTAFQLNEDFEYYGAYSTRACHNETAVVSLHTLTKHLDKLLPVMTDMLTNATFPEEELDIYKQNVRQRLTVNLQKAEFVAGRLIDAYLYGEAHPYGTYSNMEDVDALNVEQIRQFYQQYYLTGHCAIFVSGLLPANL